VITRSGIRLAVSWVPGFGLTKHKENLEFFAIKVIWFRALTKYFNYIYLILNQIQILISET